MLCVLFLFCSLIVNQRTAPTYDDYVARYLPNVFIAHNALDGQYFGEIKIDAMIRYYDGTWTDYKVTDILQMQAIPPDSITAILFDGVNSYSATWVHNNIYDKDLVLQTCIYKDGNWNWGRLFIVAEKQ